MFAEVKFKLIAVHCRAMLTRPSSSALLAAIFRKDTRCLFKTAVRVTQVDKARTMDCLAKL